MSGPPNPRVSTRPTMEEASGGGAADGRWRMGVVRGQARATTRMFDVMLLKVFFRAKLHIVILRLSEDEGIMDSLVHLEDDGVDKEAERIDRDRKLVWGTLSAVYSCVVSKALKGLTNMITVIVIEFEEASLTVS